MDSNYEAQRHLTRQRLAARREQAAVERLLREERLGRMKGLKQFLTHAFRRTEHREAEKRARQSPPVVLATTGKGKG